jgi:hypothetical protein
LDDGVQLVHIQHVFFPGIVPMYATKQPQLAVLDDALKSNFVEDGWVQWNTDFLVEQKGYEDCGVLVSNHAKVIP